MKSSSAHTTDRTDDTFDELAHHLLRGPVVMRTEVQQLLAVAMSLLSVECLRRAATARTAAVPDVQRLIRAVRDLTDLEKQLAPVEVIDAHGRTGEAWPIGTQATAAIGAQS